MNKHTLTVLMNKLRFLISTIKIHWSCCRLSSWDTHLSQEMTALGSSTKYRRISHFMQEFAQETSLYYETKSTNPSRELWTLIGKTYVQKDGGNYNRSTLLEHANYFFIPTKYCGIIYFLWHLIFTDFKALGSNNTSLHGYPFDHMGEQCRSRSSCTSVPFDLDLHYSLFGRK
jgi:hypothetical protein